MWKYLFSTALLLSAILYAQTPRLKRLEKSKSGDYIVLEANKTITLLAIRSISDQALILEEISAPSPKQRPTSWAQWLQGRAPGHTSWTMMEIDLKDTQILECYSFLRSSWISQSPRDSFLATLLQLPLKPVPSEQQRRIGPPPQEGEVDRRQVWVPPFYLEGKRIESASFEVFETQWPQDGSELSGKTICLYFDREALSPLPCWIQIDTGHITASLRAIDSGHNLPASPFRSLPRRAPEFLSAPIRTKNGGLRFSIKSPKYYKEFELFAVDVTSSKEKQIHLITHSLFSKEGEILHLDVDPDSLRESLTPHHKYTWLIMPTTHAASYAELAKPFTWIPQELK